MQVRFHVFKIKMNKLKFIDEYDMIDAIKNRIMDLVESFILLSHALTNK